MGKIHASSAGAQVWSPVRELKFHLPLAAAQNKQSDCLPCLLVLGKYTQKVGERGERIFVKVVKVLA